MCLAFTQDDASLHDPGSRKHLVLPRRHQPMVVTSMGPRANASSSLWMMVVWSGMLLNVDACSTWLCVAVKLSMVTSGCLSPTTGVCKGTSSSTLALQLWSLCQWWQLQEISGSNCILISSTLSSRMTPDKWLLLNDFSFMHQWPPQQGYATVFWWPQVAVSLILCDQGHFRPL